MLIYVYDENGAPAGIKYRTSSYAEGVFDYFFFEKNLQGDIVAIYNTNGTKIGSYTYDAWGNFTITRTSGITILENNILYNYNPFRYRGYYYDIETGWYYLQSRYYNPNWGRFLNADACLYSNILGFNLLAYCYNNPIAYIDQYGESATAALGWWTSTFWIPAISEPTIVGEILYGAGCVILGIGFVVEGIIIADKVADIIVEELDPEPEPKPKDPEPEPKPKDNTSTEKIPMVKSPSQNHRTLSIQGMILQSLLMKIMSGVDNHRKVVLRVDMLTRMVRIRITRI